MSPAVSTTTRWCPTPEQLMILEEMYRSGGVRTPNATQIQQITAHLSNYGKIEGKNVFYWFQNHKARDRQKLRRKLISKHHHHQQKQQQIHSNQLPPQHQQLVYHHHVHDHQLHNQWRIQDFRLGYILNNKNPKVRVGTCPWCPLSRYATVHNASSSSMAPGLQQFSHFTATNKFFPQGGIVGHEEKGTTKSAMANHTWKVDDMMMMERMYGQDWSMMKTDRRVGPTDSSENRPVMKTLELFPTKATNLKEECNNNNINAVTGGHHGSSLFFI